MDAEIDRLSVASLGDRYTLKKTQVYGRLKALGIEPQRQGRASYVDSHQIRQLDRLDKLIEQGTLLADAVQIVLGEMPSEQSSEQFRLSVRGSSESEQFTGWVQLARELQAIAPPPTDTLARYRQLKEIAAEGWLMSSSDLAPILGKKSLGGESFERYGFRFVRAGKNGTKTAWKVEKL